jgi:hypothetical protein
MLASLIPPFPSFTFHPRSRDLTRVRSRVRVRVLRVCRGEWERDVYV